jgi:hypothetical protein
MISQHTNDPAKARERLPQFSQLNPDVQLPDFIQAALPGITRHALREIEPLEHSAVA